MNNRRGLIVVIGVLMAVLMLSVSIGISAAGDDMKKEGKEKVTICHIPPGNPENAHTITVGEPAAQAHLDHGDHLGPCEKVVSTPPVAVTPTVNP